MLSPKTPGSLIRVSVLAPGAVLVPPVWRDAVEGAGSPNLGRSPEKLCRLYVRPILT